MSKELTMYILDVGPGMWKDGDLGKSSYLSKASEILELMLHPKLCHPKKSEEVAFVVFGSDETDNILAFNDEYQHVSVLREPKNVDLELLLMMTSQLAKGNAEADALDAIIVGIDMMQQHCNQRRYTKRMVLLTSAESPINFADAEDVSNQLIQDGIDLYVVGAGFDLEQKSKTKSLNERFLRTLVSRVSGKLFTMPEALEILSEFQTKTVRPTASFRGHLYLGDPSVYPDTAMEIPVVGYTRTTPLAIPSAKKWSTLAEVAANDQGKTHEVSVGRTHQMVDQGSEVAYQDLEKAYFYGRTLVPLKKADEEMLALPAQKGLFILGFFEAREFRREWEASNVMTFAAAPKNPHASVGLSALIHAMYEKDAYALVRYCRTENGIVKLGVLKPHIKAEYECLYYVKVPFAEDIKRVTFPSLESLGKKSYPSQEMLSRTQAFIESMSLMDAGINDEGKPKEAFRPKEMYNPVYQRLFQCVRSRAVNQEAPLPELNPAVLKQFEIPDLLRERSQEAAEGLRKVFKVQKVEPTKRWKPEEAPPAPTTTVDEILEKDDFPDEVLEKDDFPDEVLEKDDFPDEVLEKDDFPDEVLENEDFPDEEPEKDDFPDEVLEKEDFPDEMVEKDDFLFV